MALSRISLLTRILKLAGKLPLNIAQGLGSFIGLLLWWFPTRSRHATEINLGIAYPDLPAPERQRLARKSLKQTGQTIMEIPLMWEWPVERCLDLVREVEGEELLTRSREDSKGLILLAPHLGNWELAGLYFSSRYKMAALYSPPHWPEFEDYMIRVRGRLGSELVRGDRRGLARLITLLREGGVAGILPDQSPRGKTNAYAPFFGMEVRTMTLVAKLLQKSGAAVLLTYAERLPNAKGFRIVIRECEPGMADSDPVVAATALNASVEQAVLAIPEQYQWEYKRMRHRPPGEVNPYKPGRIC
ncbi:lysophospholipid acyltransferase [Marinobacter nanhaiticus D15-8W]|uniref:Lipid A biosynthesis acyltransferase n=1 Tax=Marinobacter nanhaiticus D15-8W TaxID=626887 RepID=N6WUM9_9GAMM|nr:lysophospholipid acyltransferase family protein [Marinobacter nanhaiticus]ENO12573.1 lipid A biosynthesis acyltransferase [Marinobacter nanhaiticus D15-8W]BES69910.1 lysophospholipid acyltransferase [Marinobacter nanhaiticus D15-8W]